MSKKSKDGFAVKLKNGNEVEVTPESGANCVKNGSCSKEDRKEPSEDSIYRWIGFVVVNGIMYLFFIILIVLVALPR